ncbi:MAG: Cell wall-associated polypeptide CWBP200 [Candidatus Accumulibacter adjunctus]|uniref:Cell wall-associated polypeptide CWBP200 n=1 Tax=Candidatus Accumulibacter adjunctus TaxID=1454001 RepID=A0A011PJX6_9PROT|nr:MAG: Cell wall-associated polypeptide CWBP200 [Candidatus Accumulibacter adjunctus]
MKHPFARLLPKVVALPLLLVVGAAFVQSSEAATCSYTNFQIGVEFSAQDGPDSDGKYRYAMMSPRCGPSGQVVDGSVGGGGVIEVGYHRPEELLAALRRTFGSSFAESRVFVDACRLNLILVNRRYPASHSIDGHLMAAYPDSTGATVHEGVFSAPILLALGTTVVPPAHCGCTGGLARSAGATVCSVPAAIKAADLCIGNPIVPGHGCKIQSETDYRFGGASPLSLQRHYSSQNPYHARSGAQSSLGSRWRHNHEVRLYPAAAPNLALLLRGDGLILHFHRRPGSSNEWLSDADVIGSLQQTASGWTWRDADDAIETFDSAGRRLRRVERGGLSLSYAYLPASDRLAVIEDHFGRRLTLNYNARNLLAEVITPAGDHITYTYDSEGQLVSVTMPDGHSRRYAYTQVTVDGHVEPTLLSGLTDENGNPYAAWTYDERARVASSEHAGGANRHRFSYQVDTTGQITGSRVLNPLDADTQYQFQRIFGANRIASISQPLIPGASRQYGYDANGNLASQTDYNGTRTHHTYDLSRNLETRRAEAVGTPAERTITTEWHPTYRLPLRRSEPLKRTSFAYDASGNLLSRSEQATSDPSGSLGFAASLVGSPRTWTFTYNAVGQILSVDGPRTDVADTTTYTYYEASEPDHGKRGQLASVTNALGHVTEVTAYDANGRPLVLIEPNGLVTTFSYDPRGRLTGQTVGSETTAFTTDAVGLLTRVTLPDGSFLAYTYDAAHRLQEITDAQGNTLRYTLDAAGNHVQEERRDPGGAIAQTRSRVYDALGRLVRELGAQAQLLAEYRYDAQGNRTAVSTPLGTGSRTTTYAHDALGRIIRQVDPLGGEARYAYDGQDRRIAVTDPRQLVTTTTLDGLGNAPREQSPDSGVRTRTYDAAGNLLSDTDAEGRTRMRQYDALNRLIRIDDADGSEIHLWDLGADGRGRLGRVEQRDASGALLLGIDRRYDEYGRLTQESRQLAGSDTRSEYRYLNGRLSGLTFPSGRRIDYRFDAQGRIGEVELTADGQKRTIARDIVYHPFGGLKALTNGAGQTLAWGQDPDGHPASYVLGGQVWQISHDNALRIVGQSSGIAGQSASYDYDPLDRLTRAVLPSVTHGYSYDATGNRLSQTSGAASRQYTISPTSNRLMQISGSAPRVYSSDASGNVTGDGLSQYRYNARGRLVAAVTAAGTTQYHIDPFGQRVRKTGTEDTLYHYDQEGRLISETATDGTPLRDYIWLGEQPLALIE